MARVKQAITYKELCVMTHDFSDLEMVHPLPDANHT